MLATVEDVESLLDAEVGDTGRIEALIRQAGVLVEAYCRREFTDPVPDAVSAVVSGMVARSVGSNAVDVPTGATSMMNVAGPFTRQTQFAAGSTDGGVWLTKMDKMVLRRFRGGAYSVRTW